MDHIAIDVVVWWGYCIYVIRHGFVQHNGPMKRVFFADFVDDDFIYVFSGMVGWG